MSEAQRHRKDIQGLRAIAVIIVVLYHARVPFFSGGFVGVDVFFAVSGFVIGASLLREVDATGTIELRRFYERRVRRLVPAYAIASAFSFLVVALCLEVGESQRQAVRTGIASAFSAGNLQLLASPRAYFSPAEDLNPFLHTWSLGVEEQFYLVVPLVFVAAAAAARRTTIRSRTLIWCCLVALSVASLIAAVVAVRSGDARSAFYNPVHRFWEIGAGMVVAACPRIKAVGASIMAVVGTGVVVLATVTYDSGTQFPGLTALPIVVATLALLVSGPTAITSRLLETSVLQWVGDRSYGWYLWHWPFIVATHSLWGPRPVYLVVASVAALAPAALSYRFVEQPIRFRTRIGRPRTLILGAVAIIVASTTTGSVVGAAAENDWWVDLDWARRDGLVTTACHGSSLSPIAGAPCYYPSDGSGRGELVLLVGDSHAGVIADGVVAGANAAGYSVLVTQLSACPFIPIEMGASNSEQCETHRARTWDLIDSEDPVAVLVTQDSAGYVNRVDRDPLVIVDGELARDPDDVRDAWLTAFRTARLRLDDHGVAMVSVDVVPTWVGTFASSQVSLLRPQRPEFTMSRSELEQQRGEVLEIEHAILNRGASIDPSVVVCPDVCSTRSPGGFTRYSDESHLSLRGSLELARVFERELPGAISAAT